ncbi:MAG: hypothetical protein ABIP88_00270 [Candidatus Binatia bacterium]
MSIEQAVISYSVVLGVLLVLMIWMLLRHWRVKQRKTEAANANPGLGVVEQTASLPIDWRGTVSKLRPDRVLTGEMWVKAIIAAFIALCAGTIVVVFVFPLGAAAAAIASFAAVVVIVGLFLILLD